MGDVSRSERQRLAAAAFSSRYVVIFDDDEVVFHGDDRDAAFAAFDAEWLKRGSGDPVIVDKNEPPRHHRSTIRGRSLSRRPKPPEADGG